MDLKEQILYFVSLAHICLVFKEYINSVVICPLLRVQQTVMLYWSCLFPTPPHLQQPFCAMTLVLFQKSKLVSKAFLNLHSLSCIFMNTFSDICTFNEFLNWKWIHEVINFLMNFSIYILNLIWSPIYLVSHPSLSIIDVDPRENESAAGMTNCTAKILE